MGSTVFKLQRWFIIKIKIRNCKKWVSNIKCKQNTNSILVFFPFLPSVLQVEANRRHNPHTVTDILFWWHDDTRLAFTRRHRPHNSYPLIVHTTQPVMADLYQSTRKTTFRKIFLYVQKYFIMRSKTISNEPRLAGGIHHWAVCRCKEALIVAAATGHGASTNHLK